MYNTELKEKFAKEYTEKISVRDACLSVFNAFEKYETQWGADLCTQNKETLEPVVENLLGLRAKSQQLRFVILQEYVKWCLKNQVPGACDGMLMVDVSALSKMKRQTVKNPMHLQRYLNDICDAESEQTADNTLRCFYWMAYGGMGEEDIFRVRSKDVDLSSLLVHLDGTDYPIYREAIPAFKNCMTLSQFLYKHPNYGADKTVYRDRADGDILIRGIRAIPSVMSMRAELSRRSKKCFDEVRTTLQLSYYRAWISGVFYRTYEAELAGVPVDFSGVAADFMQGKTYKLESGRNTPMAKQRKLAADYTVDYERWKATLI